jgi:dienelactone hydrolase
MRGFLVSIVLWIGFPCVSFAQPPSEAEASAIRAGLSELQGAVAKLKQQKLDAKLVADVEIYAKAVEWALRHNEFYLPKPPANGAKPKTEPKSKYPQYALNAIRTGLARAEELTAGKPSWVVQPGKSIRAYVSRVDGSVQPYAVTLPEGVNDSSAKRWPLYVVLHGRGGDRNEIRFLDDHHNKPWPKEGPLSTADFIQIDVFGRTDNAYRWAGETDVFEAMADVQRRYRIDDRRIVLWGFSMGGAGSWHLGVHHPDKWCSVGPGAGFVDYYKYQNRTEPLPPHQHAVQPVYNALEYALNAFNVPICTYGGELDKQIAASQLMVDAARAEGVEIKFLIGPKTEHKFHPDSFKEFMEFHRANVERGRPSYLQRREIRFVTYTLKYNGCDWLTIEELDEHLDRATVHAKVDRGVVRIKTENVTALQIARDIAERVELDGDELPLSDAGGNLLPGVYYVWGGKHWSVLDYDQSRAFANNPQLHKRHNLQGPIDDAFMEPFVCVLPTAKPWHDSHAAWAKWTYERFAREFDKWFRGRVPTIKDTELTDELIADKNLILFGDPGSNAVLARVLTGLPIHWTTESLEVAGKRYDPQSHSVALIYPNPLNPQRYVVINSGHTIHDADFIGTNALLFPRLGDIAVQKFESAKPGEFTESTVWATLFDSHWKLP